MDAFRAKIEIFSIFMSIHRIHSLNQGQGSAFMLRECAKSISRIKLPLYGPFLVKNFPVPEKFSGHKNHTNALFYSPCKYIKMSLLYKLKISSWPKNIPEYAQNELKNLDFLVKLVHTCMTIIDIYKIDCINFRIINIL